MINIEWKARVFDVGPVEDRLREIGATEAERTVQVDTYFDVPRGRLKLREGVRSGELIHYNREEGEAVRASHYERAPVADTRALRRLLDAALGVRGVVEKHRTVWLIGDVRVHLDRVRDLGDFVEVEAPVTEGDSDAARSRAERLLDALGVTQEECIAASYIDLATGDTA